MRMATLAAERFRGGSARGIGVRELQSLAGDCRGLTRTGLFGFWQFEQRLKEREDAVVVKVLEEPLCLWIVLTESRALKSVPNRNQHCAGRPSTGGRGRGTNARAGCSLRRSRPREPSAPLSTGP